MTDGAARAVTRGDRGTLARSRSTAERIGAMLRAGGPPPVAVRAPADGAEDEPETLERTEKNMFRQTFLFSATMPPEVRKLLCLPPKFLHNRAHAFYSYTS